MEIKSGQKNMEEKNGWNKKMFLIVKRLMKLRKKYKLYIIVKDIKLLIMKILNFF